MKARSWDHLLPGGKGPSLRFLAALRGTDAAGIDIGGLEAVAGGRRGRDQGQATNDEQKVD